MADERRPHKFHLAANFSRSYENMAPAAPELLRIAKVFIRNMNRVRGIAIFPIQAIAAATTNECARMEAMVNKSIPFHDPRITFGDANYDEKLAEEVNDERVRIINDWHKSDPDFERYVLNVGINGLNQIAAGIGDPMHEAMQASMSAMLIGLWTAFESLSQDTWIVAVDARPVPFAQRVLDPGADLKGGDQSKTVSWKVISGAGFDLRGSMGRVLVRAKKVDFQQLESIRAAYKIAFAGELEKIFESYNNDLSLLEAVRNLFVHKGGIVDEKFVNRVQNIPRAKGAEIGKAANVNGKFVSQRAESVLNCAIALVNAVDCLLAETKDGN